MPKKKRMDIRIPKTADDDPSVEGGEIEAVNAERNIEVSEHDCFDHAIPCTTNGPLGHGWECAKCGAFLQAG